MDLAALIAGIVAVLAALYGIFDVREQIRTLIALERNMLWAKLLRHLVWRFVDPTEETQQFGTSNEMHEFTMLVRALEPNKTLTEVQDAANNEILQHAKELVARGRATWKPEMDEAVIIEMVNGWQNEKNAQVLKSMFPEPKPLWQLLRFWKRG
jgi:hypothetical protein